MDLGKQIREYFESIQTRSQYILRTVKKVQCIPVTAYITREFYLIVNSLGNHDITLLSVKLEDNKDLSKNIYEALKGIRYNKKYDSFYDISKHECESCIFKDDFLDLEQCCVCHEDTSARTVCEHPLCFLCENMLKTTSCPVCRGPLYDEDELG